jgi:hypothetical protein
VVVLVGRIHKDVIKAIQYARSLHPDHLFAVYVAFDDEDQAEMERQWEQFRFDMPLEIIHSPYRELVEPVERYLTELDDRWDNDTVTVVIPEFVLGRIMDPRNLLHGQTALALKAALLNREGVVVTSVPYHVGGDSSEGSRRR